MVQRIQFSSNGGEQVNSFPCNVSVLHTGNFSVATFFQNHHHTQHEPTVRHSYTLPICPNNLCKSSIIPRCLLCFLWLLTVFSITVFTVLFYYNICVCQKRVYIWSIIRNAVENRWSPILGLVTINRNPQGTITTIHCWSVVFL